MYSGPNVARPAGGAGKTALPLIAAILCGGLLLFLLAATIVLALIPLYVPQKSITATSSTTSGQSTMNVATTTSAGRRRRQTQGADGLKNCVGGTVGSTGTGTMKKNMDAMIKAETGEDHEVIIDSATILTDSSRKRRYSLAKRQSLIIIIKIVFRLKYGRRCTSTSCRSSTGEKCRTGFIKRVPQGFDLGTLDITKPDGSLVYIAGIGISGVSSISSILPPGFSGQGVTARPGGVATNSIAG